MSQQNVTVLEFSLKYMFPSDWLRQVSFGQDWIFFAKYLHEDTVDSGCLKHILVTFWVILSNFLGFEIHYYANLLLTISIFIQSNKYLVLMGTTYINQSCERMDWYFTRD